MNQISPEVRKIAQEATTLALCETGDMKPSSVFPAGIDMNDYQFNWASLNRVKALAAILLVFPAIFMEGVAADSARKNSNLFDEKSADAAVDMNNWSPEGRVRSAVVQLYDMMSKNNRLSAVAHALACAALCLFVATMITWGVGHSVENLGEVVDTLAITGGITMGTGILFYLMRRDIKLHSALVLSLTGQAY